MTATINGKPLLRCEIRESRIGAWTAELDADADAKFTGPAVIVIDGVTWVGTVLRGDVHAGRSHASIVGGAGGLSRTLEAKHYFNAPMSSVLADTMTDAVEVLSPLTDAAVTALFLSRWSRIKGKVGAAIKQAADDANGASWRVLRDGTVWLGQETWLPAAVKYDEITRTPNRGTIVIAPDSPTVTPGSTFDGSKVARVTTTIANGNLRQELLLEDGTVGGLDRMLQSVAGFVESLLGRRIDYSQMYPSRVISQSLDGTLELYPDDPKVRGTGISRVPMKHGIPGCTIRAKPGSYVNLFFEDNDAKKPAAALWPDGSSVLEVSLGADVKVVVDAALVQLGGAAATEALVKGTGFIAALNIYVLALDALIGTIAPAPSGLGVYNTASTAFKNALLTALSTKVKTS